MTQSSLPPASRAGPITSLQDVEAAAALRAGIEPELLANERILWLGRPQGSIFRRDDAWLIPFSLIWLAVGCGGLIAGLSSHDPGDLIAVPFLVVALYLLVGRFVVKAIQRRTTIYAVTDHRVIEKHGKASMRTLSLAHVPLLEVSDRRCRGDVIFGRVDRGRRSNLNLGLDLRADIENPIAFYDVPDPRAVAQLVDDAAQALREAPAPDEPRFGAGFSRSQP